MNNAYTPNDSYANGTVPMQKPTRTIQASQLTPNELVLVKGKIVFSRITKQIDGEELQKDIQRRKNMGSNFPITKPYTTITIHDAEVLYQHNQPTPAEIYVKESFYPSAQAGATGWCYTATNKSSIIPYLAQKRPGSTNECDQVKPEGEPARDLEVVLQLRVFQSRQYGRNAITLDGVIAQEPIVYYNNNDNTARLAAAGVIYHPLPADQQPKATEQMPGAPIEEAASYPTMEAPDTPAGAPVENPYRNDASHPYSYPPMGGGANPYGQQPQGGGLRYDSNPNNY